MTNETNAPDDGASVLVTSMRVLAIAAAMLMLTMLVVTRSQAAFTASTSNTANSFSIAEFLLTDDDSAVALFTATGLSLGQTVENCITVTHTGAAGTNVNFYGENISPGLLSAGLDVKIEVGLPTSGGTFDDCSGFDPGVLPPVYQGKLNALPTAAAPQFHFISAAPSPTSRVIRFTVTVPNDELLLNQSASADFVWTATSV